MKNVVWVLPLAAILIATAVGFKLQQPKSSFLLPPGDLPSSQRMAPRRGELYDSKNRVVRVQAYLGRHKLLVFFFNGTPGADKSPLVTGLAERYADLATEDVKTFAVCGERTVEMRKAIERGGPWPFPLLSDITYQMHREWGAYSTTEDRPVEAVFVVDRRGVIVREFVAPSGLGTPDEWVAAVRSAR